MDAPICNRCRGTLDDGGHVKAVTGWHCNSMMLRGATSLVTTLGAADFPARCNGAVPHLRTRGCVLAYRHAGDCA